MGSERNSSDAKKIRLQFLVIMFLRPHVEGNCGQLIYYRNRFPVLRQINGLDVSAAGIACVHTHVVELRRSKDRKMIFVFLGAVRAQETPEEPLRATQGAKQEALGAIAFRTQYRQLRFGATKRAERR